MKARLTPAERKLQGLRLAVEILQTEEDLEANYDPAELTPGDSPTVTLEDDYWRLLVALARQVETGQRGPPTPMICRGCGCTPRFACRNGCKWVPAKVGEPSMTLCSNCAPKSSATAKKGA